MTLSVPSAAATRNAAAVMDGGVEPPPGQEDHASASKSNPIAESSQTLGAMVNEALAGHSQALAVHSQARRGLAVAGRGLASHGLAGVARAWPEMATA